LPPAANLAPPPPVAKTALPPPPAKTALPLPKKIASHLEKTTSQKKTTSSQSNRAQVAQKKKILSLFQRLQAPLSYEKIDAELEASRKVDVEKWMASMKKVPPTKKSAKELEAKRKMLKCLAESKKPVSLDYKCTM
jgi:hypothetical protein